MKLRLILFDQLNMNHSWFNKRDNDVLYLMMEIKPKPEGILQHKQKLLARFASMRYAANELREKGHKVKYLQLNDPENEHDIGWNLLKVFEQTNINTFEYQEPDDYDTDVELKQFGDKLDIPVEMFSTEHFLTSRNEFVNVFGAKQHTRVENYYKYLRKKYHILMYDDGEPFGGKWVYLRNDKNQISDKNQPPPPLLFHHNLTDIDNVINASGISYVGKFNAQDFGWPLTRQDALDQLEYFINILLPDYGKYLNTMTIHSNALYHSRLSFALNQKLLNPCEIIEKLADAYKNKQKIISLPQVESFIRNLTGYREFMRGVYWHYMPEYRYKNHLFAERKLPGFFKDGNTDMYCLHHVITQSLNEAWIHHIQRMAIIGNFALLAGIHPDETDAWFSGMFVDAQHWIQLPNTRGLSQFADAGIVASKPYAFSANYISKISDYCHHCKYYQREKTGKNACPLNTLYWHFYHRNRKRLSWIRRTRIIYDAWDNIEPKIRQDYLNTAEMFLSDL